MKHHEQYNTKYNIINTQLNEINEHLLVTIFVLLYYCVISPIPV